MMTDQPKGSALVVTMEDMSAIGGFLLRTTSDGLLIAQITDEGQHLTHINPAAASMLSVLPEEVIGRAPRDSFRTNQSLVNLFVRTGEQRLDVRLPRQRLATGIANTLNNGVRVVLLQDVTEKRDIENRREMLSKSISHDLRNPIAAITGFADLVSKFGTLNDLQLRYLQRLRQTSGKLHDMITLLVDLAWIEAGMPLAHVPIRMDDIITEVVSNIREIAHDRHISIATSLQRPLPVIMGDPERLRLVIYHLLHNAIIYSFDEGSVAIHAWGDQNELYCSIADKGIGISDSELELIFDRMYRSRDDRVREIPGGGLGLTLVRTIVQRHGGAIWASSNYGEGSTFTFVMPVVEL